MQRVVQNPQITANLKTPHADISDERILALLRADPSSEQGFRMLMEKYQERLYWQIRRLVFEHEDANDVLQNCLLKIFRNIRGFEGKSQLYTWLYRIAVNEAITHLKKKKRHNATSLDDQDLGLSNRLEADAFFDGDEAQRKLHAAIAQLPEKQRLVFNLRYFDEMGYQEMSELLGTSVGALKASFHHAVKKVEQFLKTVESY